MPDALAEACQLCEWCCELCSQLRLCCAQESDGLSGEVPDALAEAFQKTLEAEDTDRASSEQVRSAEDAVTTLLGKAQTPGITSPDPKQVSCRLLVG